MGETQNQPPAEKASASCTGLSIGRQSTSQNCNGRNTCPRPQVRRAQRAIRSAPPRPNDASRRADRVHSPRRLLEEQVRRGQRRDQRAGQVPLSSGLGPARLRNCSTRSDCKCSSFQVGCCRRWLSSASTVGATTRVAASRGRTTTYSRRCTESRARCKRRALRRRGASWRRLATRPVRRLHRWRWPFPGASSRQDVTQRDADEISPARLRRCRIFQQRRGAGIAVRCDVVQAPCSAA